MINIYQHVDGDTRLIGHFHPNISEETNQINGGNLDLNISSIIWLSGKKPEDGSEPPSKCVFSGFAELLNVSCEGAIVIVNIIGFGLLGIFLVIVVIIIKRKYVFFRYNIYLTTLVLTCNFIGMIKKFGCKRNI